MGEAALSSGTQWHLARIYSLVDACKGPRARNQQFFNELADLVCHLAVRRKHSTVVMTGTHITPTQNPPFPTRPRWHPVGAHLCSGPRRSDNADVPVLELCSPAALVCMPHHGGRDKGLRKRTFSLLTSSSLPEWRDPVLLEFDGLPEIPRWRSFIPCIFIASTACPPFSVEWVLLRLDDGLHVRQGECV
jgi:hypothetical protein